VSGHLIYVQSRQIVANGNVPVDVVRSAMDWDGWEYLRCYERDFKTADSLPQGSITLKFKIFNQLPQQGAVDKSDFTVPKFNDCVLHTALGQTANAAGSAGFSDVSYTLAFTVGDATN
jgi:hypothetical protein